MRTYGFKIVVSGDELCSNPAKVQSISMYKNLKRSFGQKVVSYGKLVIPLGSLLFICVYAGVSVTVYFS